MEYPFFSIITVCYNSEKTITDTIESILNQSYQNFEYIIIDGGSTDRTLEVIKKYKSKFEGNLRWISEKDEGIYDAMNKGINIAKGDLIGIINSDDWYNSKALEMILCNYEKNIDIYHGDIYFIEEIQNCLYIKRKNGNKLNLIKNGMSILHPSCFVNKNWYEKYKYDTRYRISADYKFILESFVNGANYKYINYPFSFMRFSGISYSNGALGEKEVRHIQSEVLNKEVSPLKRIYENFVVKFYRLRHNIAFYLLPKFVINKILKRRGWQPYEYQSN